MDTKQLAKLREDFPEEVIGKLPREACYQCREVRKGQGKPWDCCSRHSYYSASKPCPACGGKHGSGAIHLDFVGHADVTDRFLTADPGWSWEPMAFDEDGCPLIKTRGNKASMWIRLTIGGVTRVGVGTADASKDDVEKELIGDALRNAGMRFGVGLKLWSKSDLLESQMDGHDVPAETSRPDPQTQAERDEALFAPRDDRPLPAPTEPEINETSKAEAIPKADMMAAKPAGMDDDQFWAAVIAKANDLNPTLSAKHQFKTWKSVLVKPAVARHIIELLETGQFFNAAAEPWDDPDPADDLLSQWKTLVAGIDPKPDPLGLAQYLNESLELDPPVPNMTTFVEKHHDRAKDLLVDVRAKLADGEPWPPVAVEVGA